MIYSINVGIIGFYEVLTSKDVMRATIEVK